MLSLSRPSTIIRYSWSATLLNTSFASFKVSGSLWLTSSKIHGWPDLWFGWRNQIPVLLESGFRVVCPDIMGFGGTDAPPVPPKENIIFYGFKRIADDVRGLAKHLRADTIVLGGHDWVS